MYERLQTALNPNPTIQTRDEAVSKMGKLML